jgi:hypothetical protein
LTVRTKPEAEKLLDVIIGTHKDYMPEWYK